VSEALLSQTTGKWSRRKKEPLAAKSPLPNGGMKGEGGSELVRKVMYSEKPQDFQRRGLKRREGGARNVPG